jgi:hypothetical protein
MPLWNNNDREESKPNYLNKTEKRHIVRTIRGWELPQMGSQFAYGLTNGNYGSAVGLTNAIVQTELLVCLPNDPSITGATASNYAFGFTGQLSGLTFGADQQDMPYFSAPFLGDGGITGVPGAAQIGGSTGVSHGFLSYVSGFDTNGYGIPWGAPGATPALNATGPGALIGYQYGVNAYGVSTLAGLTGVTAYIKIQGHDTNLSQSLTIGLSGTYAGMALYTGISLTSGTSLTSNHIPVEVYRTFFGPTGDKNGRVSYRQDNIAVLVVGGLTATGTKTVSLTIRDNSGSTAAFGSVVGATAGTTFALVFDRPAGLTTGGGTAGGVNAPTFGQYFYTTTSTNRH